MNETNHKVGLKIGQLMLLLFSVGSMAINAADLSKAARDKALLEESSTGATKKMTVDCIPGKFRALSLLTHDPALRKQHALTWLQTNGMACDAEKLITIINNRRVWLGAADDAAVEEAIEVLLETKGIMVAKVLMPNNVNTPSTASSAPAATTSPARRILFLAASCQAAGVIGSD